MKKTGKKIVSFILSAVVITGLAGGAGLKGFAGETDTSPEEAAVVPAETEITSVTVSDSESDSQAWYDDKPDATEFTISTGGQLEYLAELVNEGADDFSGDTVTMTADIDLSGSESFTGIGITADHCFKGTFDGGGYTVTLKLEADAAAAPAGLFGYADGTVIEELTVDGSVDGGTGTKCTLGTAGLVGCVSGDGVVITGCTNLADVNGYANAGGLVGYVSTDYPMVTIENCINSGSVSGGYYVGGIAGLICEGSIRNSYNYGAVTASNGRVGGIAGYLNARLSGGNGVAVEYCVNNGVITDSSGGYTGGIAGYVYSSVSPVTIRYCGNEGAVCGSSSAVGGIVGYCVGGQTALQYLYNAGNVSSTKYVGGILGQHSGALSGDYSMKNVYNVGTVYADTDSAGGLIGYAQGDNYIINSYSAGTVSTEGKYCGILVGHGNATKYTYVTNVYYLDTLGDTMHGDGDSKYIKNSTPEAKTDAELKEKSETPLGAAFVENEDEEYHSGYLILIWELTGNMPEMYAVTFNVGDFIDCTGESEAVEAVDYTAVIAAKSYCTLDETSLSVIVNKTALTEGWSYDAETQTLTVEAAYVTGPLTISAVGVPDTYAVSFGDDEHVTYSGHASAVARNDYTATVAAEEHYEISASDITVKVNGTELTEGWSYNASTQTLTIGADCVTGSIEISAAARRITWEVVFSVDEYVICSGGGQAYAGADYTATVTAEKYYEISASDISVEVNGEALTEGWSYGGDTGTLTISADYITGPITIGVSSKRITYTVIFDADEHTGCSGESEASAGADYTAKITAETNYEINASDITVKVNDEALTEGWTYDASTQTLTIGAESITGKITISVLSRLKGYAVTFDVDEHIICDGNETVFAGADYTVKITTETGYVLLLDDIVVEVNGMALTEGFDYDEETQTLTIGANYIDGDITITAESEESDESEAYMLGDVDGDGEVTVQDVTWLARYEAGVQLSFEIDPDASDMDGDGYITVRDVTHLARYMAGVDEGYGIGEIKYAD